MSRIIHKTSLEDRVMPRLKVSKVLRQADKEYSDALKNLTYKQLLRISSAVTAATVREKYASRMFFKTLTPPEAKVAKLIQNAPTATIKQRRLRTLNNSLLCKNKAEIADIDIDSLLNEAKGQEEL